MSKIGIIYCGYNTEEHIHDSLSPWIDAQRNKLDGSEFVICAVSVPFLEYKEERFKDKTQDILLNYYNSRLINHLITQPEYVSEKEARNNAAQWLINQGITHLWLVDSDEIYDEKSITNILQYIKLERFCSWFRIPLTNYVFDKQTILEDKFSPPRIWRTETNGFKLNECIYDNDFSYKGLKNNSSSFEEIVIADKELPSKIIPSRLVDIKHYSWLSNENSRRKTLYQTKRWGENGCSFKWNETENRLEFNKEYYIKTSQKIPSIIKISS
jgi:hypothetical protein